jgi:HPr Serine kinase C-terminal domain
MTIALHATAVEIDGQAILLTGASASGKSDLALRLIDRGARLVGDDAVHCLEASGVLLVKGATSLSGRLEVRGVGIFEMDVADQSPLRLIVELGGDGVRHPESWPLRDIAGWSVPVLRLNGFAASAPIKIELALKSVVDESLQPVRLPVLT